MTSKIAFDWLRSQPFIMTLLALTAIDIVSGLIAAFITKKVSSSSSLKGMAKKAMMWLIVGVAASVDPLSSDIPETKMIALFFCATEGISIIENAGNAGIPIPKILRDSLVKIRDEVEVAPAKEETK